MMEHAEHSPAAIREKAAGAVNCQSVTLPSGLTVLCRTMPGYSSVHAMYATNFGSVVREFTLNGKRIQLPAGTKVVSGALPKALRQAFSSSAAWGMEVWPII